MTLPESSNIPSYNPPPVRRDSTLAIISLVSGIAAWVLLPVVGAIAAVICGHLAKKEIRESNNQLSGDGMALAGLILGYVQIGLLVLGLICLFTFGLALIPSLQTTSGLF